eukprot:TRINITY_DN3305_c0_g2_i1.p1 TRINITY_DN3305_c0_g2~~TRINITY_DN3305_c0_g2_i1.p1  ORF type:complete len:456 (+),score=78.36 TRINITY_DN3305_c0_g2_i1:92-1459(+)
MSRYSSLVGRHIKMSGWVKSIRRQKKFTFIDLSEGVSHESLQAVTESRNVPEIPLHHAAVSIEGLIKPSQHPNQEVEMEMKKMEVINPCDLEKDDYPFMPRQSFTPKFARGFPHLRSKTFSFASLLRTRHNLSESIRQYFNSKEFIEIHTPILTSNDCEGAGEVFEVLPASKNLIREMKKSSIEHEEEAYFDRRVYLTVSGQLHLEAMCNGLNSVYKFSPTFRAEMGRSRRHLSEFMMIEAEKAFLRDKTELRTLIQGLINSALEPCLTCPDVHNYLKYQESGPKNLEHVEKVLSLSEYPVLTLKEALSICEDHSSNFTSLPCLDSGLSREHELFLCDQMGGNPLFIVDWPSQLSPFYSKFNGTSFDGVDLLFPGVGELAGGSMRENDAHRLEERIRALSVPLESLKWYVDLRRFGSAPTGGFGLGFERLVQFILGVPNIKDTLPFPRTPHKCLL